MTPLPSPPPDLPESPHPEQAAPLPLGELPLPSKPSFPPPPRRPLPAFGRISPASPPLSRHAPLIPLSSETPDYTDADFAEALRPFLAGSAPAAIDDTRFETFLRAAFRRALSEHSSGPFHDPGFFHRSLWRLQALAGSRSYDEILQEKLRRFHVDEVHLLDREKLSLISFASADPVRHAHPRRVAPLARRLAHSLKDPAGALNLDFKLRDGRRAFVREGQYSYLVAIARGEPDDFARADLDFILKRLETRFRIPFERGAPLLLELQPHLEDCLLIHSPASPVAA